MVDFLPTEQVRQECLQVKQGSYCTVKQHQKRLFYFACLQVKQGSYYTVKQHQKRLFYFACLPSGYYKLNLPELNIARKSSS